MAGIFPFEGEITLYQDNNLYVSGGFVFSGEVSTQFTQLFIVSGGLKPSYTTVEVNMCVPVPVSIVEIINYAPIIYTEDIIPVPSASLTISTFAPTVTTF